MAICKMCHKTIPDGMDFCEECEKKRANQADESYLDSLLSSVTADLNNYSETTFENVSKHIAPKMKSNSASEDSNPVEAVSDVSNIEEPPVEETVNEVPVIEEPAIEEPVVEEPIIEEPIIDEALADESLTDSVPSDDILPSDDIMTTDDIVPTDDVISSDDTIPSDDIIPTDDIIPSDDIISTDDIVPVEDIESTEDIVSTDENILIDEPLISEAVTDDTVTDDAVEPDILTDEASIEEPSIDKVSDDLISIEEQASEEVPAEEASTEETPVEEAPIEDIQVEETPIEGTVSEEAPSEDIVTEENTIEENAESLDDIVSEDAIGDILAEINSETAEAENSSDDLSATADSADVDELLDSLLADMDAAGGSEPEPEKIDPDDLSDIFAAAEEEHIEASDDIISEESGDIAEPVVELSDDMIEQFNEEQAAAEANTASEEETAELSESAAEADNSAEEGLPGIDEIDFSSDSVESTKLDLGSDSDTGNSEEPQMQPVNPESGAEAFLTEEDLENSENADDGENIIEPIGDFDVDSLLTDLEDGNLDKTLSNLDADKQEARKNKKEKKNPEKKSWFQRLFGNIEEAPEEIAKREAKEKAELEKKKLHEENQKKRKEATKEEKEVQKAEKQAQKEEEAKKKAELKRQKQEEAKEKARKKKEERLALEEFEVNEGKINRAGATILFVIFAILTVFIIVGTNIYSYNLSIKRAEDEFEIKHYNDAYYEVYGLKIQDEDIELYDKIMTVMYVNTQLNAYEYYMTSNSRDKALDSLLKGLQRYDKYLDLAELLGIKDDLNYVKNEILEKLSSEFGIEEAEAISMLATRDEIDYSEYIYALLGTYEVIKSE